MQRYKTESSIDEERMFPVQLSTIPCLRYPVILMREQSQGRMKAAPTVEHRRLHVGAAFILP